ncbi:hypothetical protein ACH5RR_001057 [Cinchona calisaya]|uniref:Uncharacterized protein n=1 Tax=Cinchona calisaya TaxID=153742 RepID=A0ABD3B2L5_9GENT
MAMGQNDLKPQLEENEWILEPSSIASKTLTGEGLSSKEPSQPQMTSTKSPIALPKKALTNNTTNSQIVTHTNNISQILTNTTETITGKIPSQPIAKLPEHLIISSK